MSDFENTVNNIDKMMEEFQEFQNKMRLEMQERFNVLFKNFFEAFPMIKTVHWTHYTPYFNDGEECTFTIGEIYFTVTLYNDLEDYNGEDDDGNIDTWGFNREDGIQTPESLKKGIKTLQSIINNNEDIMRAMFDNYVWVRAHKDGFEVDEYEAPY